MLNYSKVLYIANKLKIKFNKFTIDIFLSGMNIELKHATTNPTTNVTDNNLELTDKIALTHLNEFNDYYNKSYGLPALERALKKS